MADLYRKKPVVIEAMQLVGSNADIHAVYQWVEQNTQGSFNPRADETPISGVSVDPATGNLLIATLGGVMHAEAGDWVIRGVQGEFYPIKDSIFRATYEPVGEGWMVDSGEADEIWWCEEHGSQFIEEHPDEFDMCLWMLYEDKWDSLPEPEPCRMVRRLLLEAGDS